MVRLVLFILIALSTPILGRQSMPFVVVLGVVQDGGSPHIGCEKICCSTTRADSTKKFTTSLALADPSAKKWWLFEATPDITAQLRLFQVKTNGMFPYLPEGIFLTHAHMGHYAGLMYLGREAMNTKNVSVYVLPKMKSFLENNGPWSQLVSLNNISLKQITVDQAEKLTNDISVTAITVPHRDEFSETAGFKIISTSKKYLFIPDIDKWEKWNRNIIDEVKQVDIAFLDATFYSGDELPGRDIKEVPHPLVTETLSLFNPKEASKIYFIHFNHTNPLLWNMEKKEAFLKSGYQLAVQATKL